MELSLKALMVPSIRLLESSLKYLMELSTSPVEPSLDHKWSHNLVGALPKISDGALLNPSEGHPDVSDESLKETGAALPKVPDGSLHREVEVWMDQRFWIIWWQIYCKLPVNFSKIKLGPDNPSTMVVNHRPTLNFYWRDFRSSSVAEISVCEITCFLSWFYYNNNEEGWKNLNLKFRHQSPSPPADLN